MIKHFCIFIITSIAISLAAQSFAAFPVNSNHSRNTAKNMQTIYHAPGKHKTNDGTGGGFGITALILGILGLIPGSPTGIFAIIFGIVGLNRKYSELARAGLILGIVGTVIMIL